ncbi:unnamed protein product [Toxocara canis]|uniref:AA_permease domain-containing protein n=1 Tax=Toxocara canis TaxID=6265 RepID=A0A183UCN5_TOXCA|nr:unnamed protein product [Toxocara canis]
MFGIFKGMRRLKTVDDEFLNHSEWIRKLGTPSLIGVAGVLSIPFGVYVIVPYTITNITGPSALLSLLIASIVMMVTGLHINELLCSMPKNCLLYNFIYATFGELPAYALGWASLLDFGVAVATVANAWSDHVNILFRGLIHHHLVFDIPEVWNLSFVQKTYDGCAMLGVLISAVILCCSIRVTATISVVMMIVTTLTTSSTVLVGFFRADPRHLVASGFFKNSVTGVIRGASCFMCAYIGIEALSYLFEETHTPRKRIPVVLPFIVFTFTLFIFFVTMIFAMTTDFSKFSGAVLLPDVFRAIKIPSARYIMTVGAVCGLSGAILVVFLPASRLLSSLAYDRLLPCQCVSHTSKKRGIPYVAVLMVAILASAFISLKRDTLFDVIAFNISIRMLLLACLVYVQHYRPDPIGLGRETARYREIGRKRFRTYSLTSYLDEKGSVINAKCSSDEDDEEESMTSSEFLQLYFSQQESAKLQHHLERKSRAADEKSSLLYSNAHAITALPSKPNKLHLAIPHSISEYQSVDNKGRQMLAQRQDRALMEATSPDVDSLKSWTAIESRNYGHNCIRSPCSPEDEINPHAYHRFHLFDRDIPELPYCGQFSSVQCESPSREGDDYRRAINILIAFIFASFAANLLILKAEDFLMVKFSSSLIRLTD